ncbi:MAG TPA: SIS domain-containing protein [Bryobacteraceae bacterium]|nr:SIS domain-containing protein [Bryobacteraceae bacterium]
MPSLHNSLTDALAVFSSLKSLEGDLIQAAAFAVETLTAGLKLLVCGNGGSACEAQHLAAELVGRYKRDRRALPALALNADGALMACIGNDYRFEDVFSRQVEAFGKAGDLLIVFSSSGQSPNICEALRSAKAGGLRTIGFLGKDGGPAKALCDLPIVVAHPATARVQEAHQFLLHCLMDGIEARMGFVEEL